MVSNVFNAKKSDNLAITGLQVGSPDKMFSLPIQYRRGNFKYWPIPIQYQHKSYIL